MATYAFERKDITLQDDKEVTLKPLPIARLRRFMKAWEGYANQKDGDDGLDIFINCCGIAIEDSFKGVFDSLKAPADMQEKGEFLSLEYKEYLADVLDIDTIYVILDVCGGIKLNDPKLQEAILAESQKTQ